MDGRKQRSLHHTPKETEPTNVIEKSRRNKNRGEEQKFRSTSTVHNIISETKSVPWKKAGTKLEFRIWNSASSLRFSRRYPCGSVRTHYRTSFHRPPPVWIVGEMRESHRERICVDQLSFHLKFISDWTSRVVVCAETQLNAFPQNIHSLEERCIYGELILIVQLKIK